MATSIPDPLAPDPMAAIEAMELTAWRIGQTARQLLRKLPDLPIHEMRPASAFPAADALDVHTDTTDAVHAAADRLGLPVSTALRPAGPAMQCEHVSAAGDVDGVTVTVWCIRFTPLPVEDSPQAATPAGATGAVDV